MQFVKIVSTFLICQKKRLIFILAMSRRRGLGPSAIAELLEDNSESDVSDWEDTNDTDSESDNDGLDDPILDGEDEAFGRLVYNFSTMH